MFTEYAFKTHVTCTICCVKSTKSFRPLITHVKQSRLQNHSREQNIEGLVEDADAEGTFCVANDLRVNKVEMLPRLWPSLDLLSMGRCSQPDMEFYKMLKKSRASFKLAR